MKKNTIQQNIENIINMLSDKHYAEICTAYGEPGYTADKGVILCNWNDVNKRVADYLEKSGYSLEWSDEWMIDYDYSKAYRTQSDSYHWQSSIIVTDDGEMLTPDDADSEWIANACMTDEGHTVVAVPARISEQSIIDEGFELVDDTLENGFFPGQNDDPKTIAKKLFDRGAIAVVFRIREVSQFYIKFQAFAKFDNEEDEQPCSNY